MSQIDSMCFLYCPSPCWIIVFNVFPCPCADKNITEGKLVIDVKYWIFNVYSETDDICTKTKCPATSDFELSHSQTLPSITPPVRFCSAHIYFCFWIIWCAYALITGHSSRAWQMLIELFVSVVLRFLTDTRSFCSVAGFLHHSDEDARKAWWGIELHLLRVQHWLPGAGCPELKAYTCTGCMRNYTLVDCNFRNLFILVYVFGVTLVGAAALCVQLRSFYQELNITIKWKSGVMRYRTVLVSVNISSGLLEKILY